MLSWCDIRQKKRELLILSYQYREFPLFFLFYRSHLLYASHDLFGFHMMTSRLFSLCFCCESAGAGEGHKLYQCPWRAFFISTTIVREWDETVVYVSMPSAGFFHFYEY